MSWFLKPFVLLWLPHYEDIYHEVMKLGNLGKADIFLFEFSTCKPRYPFLYAAWPPVFHCSTQKGMATL